MNCVRVIKHYIASFNWKGKCFTNYDQIQFTFYILIQIKLILLAVPLE